MDHDGTRYAITRKNGELTLIDAHELRNSIKNMSSRNPRQDVLSMYGGSGSFRCCKGHSLIFHNFNDGHFQHKSSVKNIHSSQHDKTACCPCLTKDYQTHSKALHILKKILEDDSITVNLHQFCEAGLHDTHNAMPRGTTVKLEERMPGVPGYLSGEIVPDVAIYFDGRLIQILEVCHTHKTNPASRPGGMVEVTARHVIKIYNEFIESNGNEKIITLKPDTPFHGSCKRCNALLKLRLPLITWIEARKEQKRKEEEARKERKRKEEEERKRKEVERKRKYEDEMKRRINAVEKLRLPLIIWIQKVIKEINIKKIQKKKIQEENMKMIREQDQKDWMRLEQEQERNQRIETILEHKRLQEKHRKRITGNMPESKILKMQKTASRFFHKV